MLVEVDERGRLLDPILESLALVVDLDHGDADLVADLVQVLHQAEELFVVVLIVVVEDHGDVVVPLDERVQDGRGDGLDIARLEPVEDPLESAGDVGDLPGITDGDAVAEVYQYGNGAEAEVSLDCKLKELKHLPINARCELLFRSLYDL